MSNHGIKPTPPPQTSRYEFFEPLGSGGTGTVYRAREAATGVPVAVKVLRATLAENPMLHQRLAQEFRAGMQLDHPNIVRALDMETDGSTSFLVYELVQARSLGEKLEAEGRLSEPEAIRIVTQIAQALHYAHQRQIVHRDVKPDNILLLADGRAKLTDFGLAKDYNNDQDLTRPASVLGTPNYMAPEQFGDAKNASPLCDVYSLGATLFSAVTGTVPFEAKWPYAVLAKKLQGVVPSAREIVPGISDRVENAIRAAMDPDPEKRPASCLAFFCLLTARSQFDNGPTTASEQFVHPGSNRRAAVRHKLLVGTCANIDTAVFAGGADTEETWPLVVRDISAGGIGVLLARRFEVGTELSVDLMTEPGVHRRFPVRVVRVKPGESGHWLHGCEFASPLAPEELTALLQNS